MKRYSIFNVLNFLTISVKKNEILKISLSKKWFLFFLNHLFTSPGVAGEFFRIFLNILNIKIKN